MPGDCFVTGAAGAALFRARGFALLVVLALLGVIASALVALSVLVVQETAAQSQQEALAQARHNAQFALAEALAVLQRQAGPDAVVTARAEAMAGAGGGQSGVQSGGSGDSGSGITPAALAWTGVWPVAATGRVQGDAHWLVSGRGDPLAKLKESESVLMVAARAEPGAVSGASVGATDAAGVFASGAEGAEPAGGWPAVRVPLVEIPQRGGAYGWWVGDEGVKVNIAATGRLPAVSRRLEEAFPEAQHERLATLLAGPSVDSLLPGPQGQVASASGSVTAFSMMSARSSVASAASSDTAGDAYLRSKIFDIDSLGELSAMRPLARDGYRSGLFHEVTFASYGVLADPSTGLRTDYSLAPETFPLGGQFASYADHTFAMETPAEPRGSRDMLIPGKEDLRRRYRISPTAAVGNAEVSAAVAPLLTDCYLLFSVHSADAKEIADFKKVSPTLAAPAVNEIVIHAGALITLWNPYTSALVPQDLLLEVEGLPDAVNMVLASGGQRSVNLRANMRNVSGSNSWWIALPFDDSERKGVTPSWLPGRFYSWLGPNNFSSGAARSDGMTGAFYEQNLGNAIWLQRTGTRYITSGVAPDFRVGVTRTNLTLRLRQRPPGSGTAGWANAPVLAEFSGVDFDPLSPSNAAAVRYPANTRQYQFGFRVRLADPGAMAAGSTAAWDKSAWLRGADPRSRNHSNIGTQPTQLTPYHLPNGRSMAAYVDGTGTKGFHKIADYESLWYRPMGASGVLTVEDVPLFELPRHAPLRVADLRHLHIEGQRPYAIGNRWGALGVAGSGALASGSGGGGGSSGGGSSGAGSSGAAGADLNRVFDRGFFSGASVWQGGGWAGAFGGSSGGGLTLSAAGTAALLPAERLHSAANTDQLLAAGGRSAQYLMLHGAFNINSFSPGAWRAVLAGQRYGEFDYVYSDHGSGEFNPARPSRSTTLGVAAGRYSQSAAETFDTGSYASSNYAGTWGAGFHNAATEPPTSYFRRGLSELTDAQLDRLALAVTERLRERAQQGLPPFGSFAEFLGPVPLASFAHPLEAGARMSVLEAAVIDVMRTEGQMNLSPRQRFNYDQDGKPIWWDTPAFINAGDLWAQFAHYAAVRSDTFRIRTYGRSASGEAHAWCEALVQRLPEPFAGSHASGGGSVSGGAVSGAAQMQNPDPQFGRRFRLVSVRWLSAADL